MYYTVLHCTVLHSTALYCTAHNYAVTVLYCLKILNCILYCIIAFIVEKNALKKKNQKMSEVAVGGGSQNFRHCLKFYAFFNLSLGIFMTKTIGSEITVFGTSYFILYIE